MASESSLSNSESIALKALSGVGLAIFTALMIVHWNHVLSKVQTAEETAPQTATATTAPPATPSTSTTAATSVPSTSTSSVAPSATTTSAIATSSTTSTPTTTTSPVTVSTSAPITTATTTATTTAPASATATTATTVETAPAEPMTTAAASAPATNAIAASSTTESTDPAKVEVLQAQLYNTLDQAWKQYPTFSQDLVYKVTVSGDGTIVDYQPIHQTAIDYLNETPLDGISTNSAASGTDFMVVMTPSGILEVNPWLGK